MTREPRLPSDRRGVKPCPLAKGARLCNNPWHAAPE